jgi:hypothetical protein
MANIETAVQDWATEAADGFLNRKVDLNTTIKKIASRERLNREKVARVVEEANKKVFLTMFPKQADKTFQFPVADISKIIDTPIPGGGVKLGAMARITPPPTQEKTASPSELIWKRAMEGSGPQQAWNFLEKAILARDLLAEKSAMSKRRLLETEEKFCKTAQQMVLQEDYTFPEIAKALGELHPEHFPKIALLLKAAAIHMGVNFTLPTIEKKAAMETSNPIEHEVAKKINCGTFPVEIINGSHQLVVSLDTLIDQATQADKDIKNLWSADDTVRYTRKELRNYLSSHRYA